MSSYGRTCPVKLKFQWSYYLSIPDMSDKWLWKSVKGTDKSGGPDLLLDRSNQYDRCSIPV
jgi:hypothetical protein